MIPPQSQQPPMQNGDPAEPDATAEQMAARRSNLSYTYWWPGAGAAAAAVVSAAYWTS